MEIFRNIYMDLPVVFVGNKDSNERTAAGKRGKTYEKEDGLCVCSPSVSHAVVPKLTPSLSIYFLTTTPPINLSHSALLSSFSPAFLFLFLIFLVLLSASLNHPHYWCISHSSPLFLLSVHPSMLYPLDTSPSHCLSSYV